MSVGEAGAEMKLLSRDLELGGLGGSCACALATSSHSSLLVYTMKLSSRRLSGAQEILPDLSEGRSFSRSSILASSCGTRRDSSSRSWPTSRRGEAFQDRQSSPRAAGLAVTPARDLGRPLGGEKLFKIVNPRLELRDSP